MFIVWVLLDMLAACPLLEILTLCVLLNVPVCLLPHLLILCVLLHMLSARVLLTPQVLLIVEIRFDALIGRHSHCEACMSSLEVNC